MAFVITVTQYSCNFASENSAPITENPKNNNVLYKNVSLLDGTAIKDVAPITVHYNVIIYTFYMLISSFFREYHEVFFSAKTQNKKYY
jgi:hypothetical protein